MYGVTIRDSAGKVVLPLSGINYSERSGRARMVGRCDPPVDIPTVGTVVVSRGGTPIREFEVSLRREDYWVQLGEPGEAYVLQLKVLSAEGGLRAERVAITFESDDYFRLISI